MLVLSCPVGAAQPLPGQGHEPGLVVGVVLHRRGQRLEPVELAGQARGERGRLGVGRFADEAGRFGGGVGGDHLDPWEVRGEEAPALGGRMRERHDPPDGAARRAGDAEQVEVHVEHHLALDQEVHVEDEAVDGGVHGALDGVLDGDEGQVDAPGADRLERVGQRGRRHDVAGGVVGLGEERLLGERARRPEEGDRPDPCRCRRPFHVRAG